MALATSGRPRGLPAAVTRIACYALSATWHYTANLITIGRLASIPLLLLLLEEGAYASAFYLFLAAAVSDGLDGFLAKRFTGVTRVGVILDPIADKLLMVGLLAALAHLAVLPAWLFFLTLVRDVLIVVGVILLRSLVPGYRIAPNLIGKLCTFLQLVLGGTALASLELVPAAATFVPPLIGLTAFVTVLSGTIYLVEAVRLTARPATGGTS